MMGHDCEESTSAVWFMVIVRGYSTLYMAHVLVIKKPDKFRSNAVIYSRRNVISKLYPNVTRRSTAARAWSTVSRTSRTAAAGESKRLCFCTIVSTILVLGAANRGIRSIDQNSTCHRTATIHTEVHQRLDIWRLPIEPLGTGTDLPDSVVAVVPNALLRVGATIHAGRVDSF